MNLYQQFLFLLICCFVSIGCTNKSNIQSVNNPATADSKYPYFYSTGTSLYMSWLTKDSSNKYSLQYARYSKNQWSDPQTIAVANDSSWFVNWADFPSIIANNDSPIAAHWLNKKTGGAYAYDVNISIADSGNHWQKGITPHQDETATEHGFVSMIPWDSQKILVVWLDGRRTAGRSDEEYYNLDKAMALRGAFISFNGKILDEFLIDKTVCDCCQTSLVKTETGAIVAYRNRTEDEIRDIYISRFDGSRWSKPKSVYHDNWKIGGCPVNGPKIVAQDSTVAVSWHTTVDKNPKANIAISHNEGKTFTDPVQLNKNKSLGRIDAAISGNNIYASWMEQVKQAGQAKLQLAILNNELKIINTQTVGLLNSARKTGFPQMGLLDEKLFFAWTNNDSTSSKIITKTVDPNN